LLTLDDENGTTLAGEIRNTTITATTVRLVSNESLDPQGRSNGSIQLDATVERESGSERLLGALTSYDCPNPAVTSFSAKRRAAETTQGP
jgi:hypothetical protein